MNRLYFLIATFLFSTFSVFAQYPTEQPLPETKEVELDPHFEQYGVYYVIAGFVLLVVLIAGYILRWGKRV